MKERRNCRKIVVNGKTFQYLIGRSAVVIYDDADKRHYAHVAEVKGLSPDLIERGQYKKTSDGMITPKNVAHWIGNCLTK